MQYTLSFTPRMVMIAILSMLLLCVLLFLAGMEIGKRMADPQAATPLSLPTDLPAGVKAPKLPKLPTAAGLVKSMATESK